MEKRKGLIVGILVAAFALMVAFGLTRRFGHDELFTYYMAQAPTFSHLVEEIQQMDLNPPLSYLVIRYWQQIFGVSEVATRLPSALLFLFASLMFVKFLARRVGYLWAAAAVVLFWCSPYFQYATEIRPYALLLAFFSLALVSWDRAVSADNRKLALAGVFLGIVGMMLSHVFALFSVGALLLAELVRTIRRREVDWVLWAMLLLPLFAGLTYLPLMQRYESGVFPERFQGGPRKVAVFFGKLLLGLKWPLVMGSELRVLPTGGLARRNSERFLAVPWRITRS